MRFVSTQGGSRRYTFREMLQTGFAEDGGILMPETWPNFAEALPNWLQLSFGEVCFEVLKAFCPNSDEEGGIPHDRLRQLVVEAHESFDHGDVAPIVPFEEGISIAELFHGPSKAFKDLAMQVMGRLLEYCVQKNFPPRAKVVISTTGDTGPSAIEALRGKEGISVYVLYPLYPSVSRTQEMQMISKHSENVHVIGTTTTADENDEAMKRVFADESFRTLQGLTTINSINLGRLLLAAATYFFLVLRVEPSCSLKVVFAIPSGAFGNATSAWMAKTMGCPISKILVANNANDVTHRMLQSGRYEPAVVKTTLAPAIDCQKPYNLERLFALAAGSVGGSKGISSAAPLQIPQDALNKFRQTYETFTCSDAEIEETMQNVWARNRYFVDPHTACGIYAARKYAAKEKRAEHIVSLATAHPSKFVETVRKNTGGAEPLLPAGLRFMKDLPKHVDYSLYYVCISSDPEKTLRECVEKK